VKFANGAVKAPPPTLTLQPTIASPVLVNVPVPSMLQQQPQNSSPFLGILHPPKCCPPPTMHQYATRSRKLFSLILQTHRNTKTKTSSSRPVSSQDTPTYHYTNPNASPTHTPIFNPTSTTTPTHPNDNPNSNVNPNEITNPNSNINYNESPITLNLDHHGKPLTYSFANPAPIGCTGSSPKLRKSPAYSVPLRNNHPHRVLRNPRFPSQRHRLLQPCCKALIKRRWVNQFRVRDKAGGNMMYPREPPT
jgi:hypothetical protein